DKGIFNESGTVTIDRNAAINIYKNQTGIWNQATCNILGGSYWTGSDTIGGIRSNTGQGIVNYGTLTLSPDPANNKRIDIAQNGYNGIYNEGVVSDNGAYIWGNTHAGVVNGADGKTNPTYIKTSGNFDNNGYEGLANRGNANVSNSNIYNNGSNGVTNYKTATISNSTIYNNGIKSGWAVAGVCNGGNITLANDTIRNNRFINAWNNVGTMTINGGSNFNNGSEQTTNFGVWNNDTLNINSGSFYGFTTDRGTDGASCLWNCKTANVRGGNFNNSHYGLVNWSTLNQSGGSSNGNSVYDVYQGGNYNLSGASRADKIFLCAGKIVNVNSTIRRNASNQYNNYVLSTADNDKQVNRQLVKFYTKLTPEMTAFMLASNALSNNPNGSLFDGVQNTASIMGIDDMDNPALVGNVNGLYLSGNYKYTYNWEVFGEKADFSKPMGYRFNQKNNHIPNSEKVILEHSNLKRDADGANMYNYLKFAGFTYDKDWMSKNWDDIKILDEDYVHALKNNEQVYAVFDLQNVSIAYYGNGATKAKGIDAKQTKDGEYYFVQDSISNSSNTTYADNPYIRSEKATRYDKNKEQDEEYTKTYTYVGWSPIRDNDKTSTLYKGNGNYDTYKAGDKPSNWTAMFMDAINKGHVSYDNGKAYINLYAIWDEAPDIDAVDIWLNYGTCQSYLDAGIMKDRLLQPDRVVASDREDGTNVVIDFYDYNEQELRDIINSTADFGGTSITYRVTDKSGNVNYKTVMVHLNRGEITSQEPVIEEGEDPLHPENNFTDATGTTYHYVVDKNGEYKTRPAEIYCRNINYNNYMKHWKEDGSVDKAGFLNGALETYSKWYLDEDLKEQMLDAMEILEKDEGYPYEQTFDRETIAKIQDEIYSDANKMQMSYIRDVWKYQYMDFSCKSKPYHEKKLIKQGKI
ncbi:MAG: hypothetical protein K6B67_05880, partial [Lachnospiraceae bacterium]|nr:hypothetical protein [Lachnospiraceae bacterium]